MQVAMLGLGRMGKHMALLLKERGHDVVCWNRSPGPREEVAAKGCRTIDDHKRVASLLTPPRVVWLMLPAGEVTDQVLFEVLDTLAPGDILIDGGNSHYKDTLYHNVRVSARGVRFVDVGVSGGLLAVDAGGYCTMVGGPKDAFDHLTPLLRDLSLPNGFAHMGPAGSGHYVKMVHNAIEYAHMQAIGEGFDLLKNGYYKDLDLHAVAKVWNHGSILFGALMSCTERALSKDATLSTIQAYVEDNGEGKWTVLEALEHDVPFDAGAHAVFSRFQSRTKESFAYKLVAAQRREFGGHAVKEATQK